MSGDTVKLSVMNIGGIEKPVTVEFRKGVNVIEAPNSSGKTSLIRGLISLFSPVPPSTILNIKATEGYVELTYNGKKYRRVFRRCGDRIRVLGELPPFYDERAIDIAVVTPENKLLAKIMAGEDKIGDFLANVSRIKYYEVALDVLEELLGESLKELEMLKEKKKGVERILQKIKSLEGEVRSLKEKINKVNNSNSLKALLNKLSMAEKKYNELASLLNSKKKSLKAKEEELGRIVAELDEIGKKYPNYDFKSVRELLEDRIRRIHEETLRGLKKELRKIEKVKTDLVWSIKKQDSNDPRAKILIEELGKLEAKRIKLIHEMSLAEKEIRGLEKKLNEVALDEKRYLKLLSRRNVVRKEINTLKMEIEALERKAKTIALELERLRGKVKEEKGVKSEEELKREVKSKEEELRILREQLRKELEKQGGYPVERFNELKLRVKILEELVVYIERRYGELVHGARDSFRRTIKKLFEQIGFKGFEAITLDENDRLLVIREGGYKQDISTLSTSEKITIALILLLSAYKCYLDGFPFFIVDEVLISYDPVRLRHVLEYASKIAPYVIVTKLPNQRAKRKLMVLHSINEANAT